MFRAQRNEKSPSSGEKIDFMFSNFQALQVISDNPSSDGNGTGLGRVSVPKVWDKLLVSIISVETGKTIARSNKALVRNGNCQWTETLSGSIWISHYDSSKDLEEHLFRFVVSMGSARSGILGEATVNIVRYYTSSRPSSTVSLPLKKCNYDTILQVKIQCLTPRTKLRVEGLKYSRSNTEVVDEDCDDAGRRSNGSAATLNLGAKFPSGQDLAPTSLLEKIKAMETSYGSTFKSRRPHGNQKQENARSSPTVPPSSSVMSVGSSKNLLEAAEEEYKTTLSVKEDNIKNLESKLSERNETEKDQMGEIQRLKMKVSKAEKECSVLSNKNLELICELKETNKVIKNRNETIEENHTLLESYGLKIRELESLKVEQEAQISDLEKENTTSKCLDDLRNDLTVLNSSLDSQVSDNKLLEQKAMKIEKVKCEMELCLFEKEEENIKLLERVSELDSQLRQVKDEHEITRLELEKSESEKSDLQKECEYVKSEKQKLQESAENLIEECSILQKSYEDMTKGNAELYDQYSSLVVELTSETEKFQKEVECLKEEISRLDEQKSKLTTEKSKLESSLKEVHSRTETTENEIQTVREESELTIQDLTTELAAIKQNHKKLMADHEKKSKLLTSYKMREERKRTMENNLELKLTVSEHERQQLVQEASNLKDEVLHYKQKLEKLKNEKSNLEASLHSVSNSFDELKAEKMSFFNKMSEFEDCKSQRDALEEKLWRLEGDLKAKNASRSHDADVKNEISRIKSSNLRYRLKIQQLEGEKNECLKKIQDLQLLVAKTKTRGVHETRSQDDTDYAAKIKMLEAELNEALDANNKYRAQLQKLQSEGHNSISSVQRKSKVEGEMVTKERFERTKSSLERELKELRERYLEMSLKYAEVEAEREDLIMQLKTNTSARKQIQLLENPS